MSATDPSFGVLISGRGSNMVALLEASRDARIAARPAVVISNRPDAAGLDRARALGVETVAVDHRDSPSREEHDRKVAAVLDAHQVDLVCLAGYMRLLSASFVQRYAGRVMNVHPSLLPAFPGLHAQRQALEHGVKRTGCTVHFVDEELDHGPIIVQIAVHVREADTEETLSSRILEQEHRAYTEAVRLFFRNRLTIEGRRVRVAGAAAG